MNATRSKFIEKVRWPISRVLSPCLHRIDDYSSGMSVARHLARHTRTVMWIRISGLFHPASVPIRSCFRWGLPCLPHCWGSRCALTAPFHPYHSNCRSLWRFAFCGTFPKVTLAGRYPAPCIHEARTFLPYDVTAISAIIQPPDGD